MPKAHSLIFKVVFLLTGVIYPAICVGNTPAADKSGPAPRLIATPATCPSRSINYITQTLPNQCLTTSWKSQPPATDRSSLHTTDFNKQENIEDGTTFSLSSAQGDAITAKPTTVTSSSDTTSSTRSEGLVSQTPQPQREGNISEKLSSLQQDNDVDPLSDHANFLSFEEWKTQMLKKAGQSTENLGTVRRGSGNTGPRQRPGNINNVLDSLGEDNEIELDFGGFVGSDAKADAVASRKSSDGLSSEGQPGRGHREGLSEQLSRRSKDAGKTCKERSNYASFDCAATVLKSNPECKGTTAVLFENKDSYMLNECSAKNKFFIVELCNDILIDTVVLANFEFFSSTFRTFRVSVSDRYPVKLDKWRNLGTFEAKNTREVQAFLVENPLIWARYLRVEFLTHYGNEYYCPVSLLRVHGKTMMEDYRHDVKAARGEEDDEDDVSEVGEEANSKDVTEIITTEVIQQDSRPYTQQPDVVVPTVLPIPSATEPSPVNSTTATSAKTTFINPSGSPRWFIYRNALFEQQDLLLSSCKVQSLSCDLEFTNAISYATHTKPSLIGIVVSGYEPTSVVSTAGSAPSASETAQSSLSSAIPSISTTTASTSHSAAVEKMQNSTKVNHTVPTPSKTAHHAPAPTPTTQESFFKSIHKRLKLLESNSTLSLQYIEEQSRILRDAFTKVERRQLAKTTTFLETLNTTVLNELRDFRLQYDQIWQSTVLELSSQREQSQREVIALSGRLSILADEILFQKRMAIVQFSLILLCLGLVIFSRNTSNSSPAYLELQTAVQNIVGRPSASFSRYLYPDGSPPGSPSRPTSRYGFFSRKMSHFRSRSDDSILNSDEGRKSPSVEYSPPTPVSDHSGVDDDVTTQTPEGAQAGLRRAISSPAIGTAPHDTQNENEDSTPEAEDNVGVGGSWDMADPVVLSQEDKVRRRYEYSTRYGPH